MSDTRKVTIKAFRFNADADYLPTYKEYEMEVGKDELILDLLNRIKWEHDGSFSYRRSCRHGICGACGIKVNGKPVLSCKENAMELLDMFNNELVIEPLSKKRAIKDMIIDKGDFWDKHDSIHPYLFSDVEEHPEHEHIVTPEEAEELNEADLCIQCGACHYACPVVELSEDFFGPAAFAKAYRFEADVRDDAHDTRLQELNKLGQGVWDCAKCYECAEVCPKEVNPIDKITKLHQMLFKEGVAKSNVATRHAVGFKHSIAKRGVLDEGQLVLYSEGPSIVKHIPVAIKMLKKGRIAMPWNIPTSDNMDEIAKLVKSSSTAKF